MTDSQPTGAEKPDTQDIDDIQVEVVTRENATPERAAPTAETGAEAQDENKETGAEEPGKEDRRKVERLPKWAEDKLAEESFRAREANRRAKELEDKLKRYETDGTKPPAPTAADADAARANAPEPGGQYGGYPTQAAFDTAVQAEANRREQIARMQADQQKFNEASNAAYSKGKEAYGEDFDAVIGNLLRVGFLPMMDQATGAVQNRDLLDLVLASDEPARVLYELGSDPGRARELIDMPANKRAVEIAKLGIPQPKKQPPVSRAPRPVDTVEGSARVTIDPRDDDDDATWFAKREAQLKTRA